MTEDKPQRRFTLMDYMAFIGGAINFIVISYIIGYWFISN